MKNMTKLIISFCVKLILIMSVILSIHIGILYFFEIPLFENKIIPAYVINTLLAIIIFISLIKLSKKYDHILGFVFLIGSFLKFGVFFVCFYPIFKQDGNVNALESTSFLAPYFACLIIETFYLVKLMNNKL